MSTASTTNPAELPPHLEAVIDQLRAALLPGADAATKGAAAHACRVLLGVLDAQPGQPLQVPTTATASAAPTSAPMAPMAPAPSLPIDRFLAAFVTKFGAELPAADPSVPFVTLGHASSLFAQFANLGGASFGGGR